MFVAEPSGCVDCVCAHAVAAPKSIAGTTIPFGHLIQPDFMH